MAIIETPPQPKKRKHAQPEAKIQASCVEFLWNNYPETRGLYIHIPNEGNRNSKLDGAMRKALGLVAGAQILFSSLPATDTLVSLSSIRPKRESRVPSKRLFKPVLSKTDMLITSADPSNSLNR